MTKFDESIAKLVWLSPHTCADVNWEKTKLKTLLNIFPLIGNYFLFEQDENGEYYLESILNELKEVVLPNDFFERSQNEKFIATFELKSNFIKNCVSFRNIITDNRDIKELETTNQIIGYPSRKGFEKDIILQKDEICFKGSFDINASSLKHFSPLQIEYLEKTLPKLLTEDKKYFINILQYLLSQNRAVIPSFVFYINIPVEKTENIVKEKLKSIIKCLKTE